MTITRYFCCVLKELFHCFSIFVYKCSQKIQFCHPNLFGVSEKCLLWLICHRVLKHETRGPLSVFMQILLISKIEKKLVKLVFVCSFLVHILCSYLMKKWNNVCNSITNCGLYSHFTLNLRPS